MQKCDWAGHVYRQSNERWEKNLLYGMSMVGGEGDKLQNEKTT